MQEKLKNVEEVLKALRNGFMVRVKGYEEDFDNYVGIYIGDYDDFDEDTILSILKSYTDWEIWTDDFPEYKKTICEKCWGDAHRLSKGNNKSQYENYLEIIKGRH